ncbi:MAG: hypothetical protein OXF20_06210 [Gammaproteobacteria bacterium]|nr:hypothetical protein [Gammaproteobacteria bacterium]
MSRRMRGGLDCRTDWTPAQRVHSFHALHQWRPETSGWFQSAWRGIRLPERDQRAWHRYRLPCSAHSRAAMIGHGQGRLPGCPFPQSGPAVFKPIIRKLLTPGLPGNERPPCRHFGVRETPGKLPEADVYT